MVPGAAPPQQAGCGLGRQAGTGPGEREEDIVNADHMAEFLRQAGYKVIRSRNSYWYEASRSVYLSIPPT